jgi:2,3-bisphosphoglycerate-dependent phosphoglycerate mutase
MVKLVLLRHGESLWNKKKIFTGWVDIDLSRRGLKQARQAGRLLKKHHFTFDVAYTSVLKRAIRTLWLALDEMDLLWLPVVNAWQLNERHYGGLQGLNKVAMAKKFGAEQVRLWRRSYRLRPPLTAKNGPYNAARDPRYRLFGLKQVPRTESLADTYRRVMPYWFKEIEPKIIVGQKIIISAHGNSLRALVKHLDNVSDRDIPQLEIPVGRPLVYEFNVRQGQLAKKSSYYLK